MMIFCNKVVTRKSNTSNTSNTEKMCCVTVENRSSIEIAKQGNTSNTKSH